MKRSNAGAAAAPDAHSCPEQHWERPAKKARSATDTSKVSTPTPKVPCQPLGNLLFRPGSRNARHPGLGNLAVLSDELVSSIFSELAPVDLLRAQAVSKAFFAFARIEGHWKLHYVKRARGDLGQWRGSWRESYISTFFCPHEAEQSPTSSIDVQDVYSDVLYLPSLAAKYDANTIVQTPSFANNIARKDGRSTTAEDLVDTPFILTNAMTDWAAMSSNRRWSIPALAARFAGTQFRAEAVLTTMSQYKEYHDSCLADESPLYVFDPDFVEKTEDGEVRGQAGQGLGEDFSVPAAFKDDLFKVLGDERPNYRWLVCRVVAIDKPS